MNITKSNIGLMVALALLALPAAAQTERTSLKDELNRQPTDITIPDSRTPEEQAIVHYQQGVALVQKAIQQQVKANENEGAKREKILKKATKAFEGAANEFRNSTQQNPTLIESWSGLGWVYRQLGQWDAAVDAYDRALTLDPNFAAAVEGRAEACLQLNRTDEVIQAYSLLERSDAKNARQLLGAVETWVRQKHSAGEADTDDVRELMALVVEKRQAS